MTTESNLIIIEDEVARTKALLLCLLYLTCANDVEADKIPSAYWKRN